MAKYSHRLRFNLIKLYTLVKIEMHNLIPGRLVTDPTLKAELRRAGLRG